MRKQSLGEVLREARVTKKISLDEMEESTGISSHYLLAMELDQFKIIPDDKRDTFLKQYANIVSLDYLALKAKLDEQNSKATEVSDLSVPQIVEEKLSRRQKRTYKDPFITTTTPIITTFSSSEENKENNTNTKGEEVSSRLSKYDEEPKSSKSLFSVIILSLIAIAILSFIFFAVWKEFSKENSKIPESASQISKVTNLTSKSQKESTSSEIQTTVVTEGQDNHLIATVTKANATVEVEVSLTEAESAWFALSNTEIDQVGTTLTKETPSYKTTFAPEISQSIMTLGIPKGIEVKVDGQIVDLTKLTSTDVSYITLNFQK